MQNIHSWHGKHSSYGTGIVDIVCMYCTGIEVVVLHSKYSRHSTSTVGLQCPFYACPMSYMPALCLRSRL